MGARLANSCPTTVHDPDYRTSWNDWSTFVESLSEKIAEKDETIPELPVKHLVFRIYRDIRFSSDPTPYKVCMTFPPRYFQRGSSAIYLLTYFNDALFCCLVGISLRMPFDSRF